MCTDVQFLRLYAICCKFENRCFQFTGREIRFKYSRDLDRLVLKTVEKKTEKNKLSKFPCKPLSCKVCQLEKNEIYTYM